VTVRPRGRTFRTANDVIASFLDAVEVTTVDAESSRVRSLDSDDIAPHAAELNLDRDRTYRRCLRSRRAE
jgi:hypothetical protein